MNDIIKNLERFNKKGWCINLINDDQGNWAFSSDGMQNIRFLPDGDHEGVVLIKGNAFKPTIAEAWEYFKKVHENEQVKS